MKIKLTKKGDRNQLVCTRSDGSYVSANLGQSLPYHDLAHFVIEKKLQLKHGFFGNVSNGYSILQLSEKETVQTPSS